ncbi:Fe-S OXIDOREDUCTASE [Fimbriiglobus ruber]|uniref:Fe-S OXIDOREDUCTASE n=1 Tax=Fimbriiglobus ruber TaxID=1908690 RepID=A0A225ECA0_9BACT|nr:Fe-S OXIDOREDUCTASE [Fimbriiglobus ruber]
MRGDHYHTVANPANGEKAGERGAGPAKTGYRPGRKTQQRRKKGEKGGSGSRP